MALRLVVQHPKQGAGEADEIVFEFEQARVMIGRSAGADVRLPDRSVSDSHATIERAGDGYTVRDQGSTNGTRVNGKPLIPGRPRVLVEGDELVIAQFTLSFAVGTLQHGTTLPERTASLARRMMRELLGSEHVAQRPPYLRAMEGIAAGRERELGAPPARLQIGELEDSEQSPAELVRDTDGTLARALDARGIEVNGKRVRERRLRHGDVLRAGSEVVIYQDLAEQVLRELEHQGDEAYREPATATLSAHVPSEPEPEPPPLLPSSDPPPPNPVDLVIYGLAALVLACSLLGLFWLFR